MGDCRLFSPVPRGHRARNSGIPVKVSVSGPRSPIFEASIPSCTSETSSPPPSPRSRSSSSRRAAPRAWEDLYQTIRDLEPLRPSFVSVTYGAGGTTREMTHDLVVRIKQTTSIPPVPHLTCVGHTKDEVRAILERYAAAGVANILALRGDPPRDQPDYDWSKGDFRHAADLVRFIREFNESGAHPDPRGFGIGVAGFPEGHPATPNRVDELDFLKAKVDAGADYICTQLFFDNHDFFDFRDRCRLAGIEVPIIAGVMPVTSLQGMKRMAELAAGARYPAKLIRTLNRAELKPGSRRARGHPLRRRTMRRPARRGRGRHPFLHAQQEPRHARDLPQPRARFGPRS